MRKCEEILNPETAVYTPQQWISVLWNISDPDIRFIQISGQDQQLKKIGPGKIKWTRKKCFSNTALTVIKESVDYLNYTQYTFKTRHSDSDFPDPDPSFTQIKDSYFSIGSTLVLTLTSIFSRSSFQSSANRWASSFFIEGCRDWNSADRSI